VGDINPKKISRKLKKKKQIREREREREKKEIIEIYKIKKKG